MEGSFDIIVIGVGSMGAPACYFLARQGYRVLGLEQFSISHEFGSHAGQSRIIRKAYFENADYVPLLQRAYENWKLLEEETGERVYVPTGLAYFGPSNNPLITGVRQSALQYAIPVEALDTSSVRKRFPQFQIPAHFTSLYERDAGFVTPEKAIRLYATQAEIHGAAIHTEEKVLSWEKMDSGFNVITTKRTYHSEKLVITSGAWTGKLIPPLAGKLRISRQFIGWMDTGNEKRFDLGNFPCWMLAAENNNGCYYGFPALPKSFEGPSGLKVAHHFPATAVDPDVVDRNVSKDDTENLHYVLQKIFKNAPREISSHKICLYSNSPDEDFIIDSVAEYDGNLIVACGFSGHGFKFSSVVGEILCQLATTGKSELPIGFLSLERFSPHNLH